MLTATGGNSLRLGGLHTNTHTHWNRVFGAANMIIVHWPTALGPELGKVTLKSNGDEALSDEFLLKSNNDEVVNDVFP